MKLDFSTFPDPFEQYGKEHQIKPAILEKLYRTGFLWREYDNEELLEYLILLTKHARSWNDKTLKDFIRHADLNEEILTMGKRGKKECLVSELEDKALAKRLIK